MNELAQYLPGILLSYAAFVLAVSSPGPNVLAVMSVSMNAGRRAGVWAGLGIAMGSLSWALLSVLGISAMVAAYAPLLFTIKILGGIYLLFLAWKAFRAAGVNDDIEIKETTESGRSNLNYAGSGYLIMMTNPKAILAWVAIVSLGIQDGSPWWVGVMLISGTFVISIIAHVSYAILFSTPIMVAAYRKCKRYIQVVFGTFFTIAGLRLLTSDR